MTEQSIDALRRAFDEWRVTKRHRTERIPDNLLKRARELTIFMECPLKGLKHFITVGEFLSPTPTNGILRGNP